MKIISGGVIAPKGFLASGTHVGLKKIKKDLSLILSQVPATTAALFTTNQIKAAPVLWSQDVLEKNQEIRAIITNSGNANACTGEQGFVDVKNTSEKLAIELGILQNEILICSTGVIGVPMPMEKLIAGIPEVVKNLGHSETHGIAASEAIMTTDTYSKSIAIEIEINGKIITIGGIAKGSGMIHPNMATMLAFITTDAKLSPEVLKSALFESAEVSYHMISVDGDTSTNDSVMVMANGMSGIPLIEPNTNEYKLFVEGLNFVNKNLAQQIIKDGEGATKFIEVNIKNAINISAARKLAKSIISSNLVKTAIFGQDANWGRVVCAMGYSGIEFNPENVDLSFASKVGEVLLYKAGVPVPFDEQVALEILTEKEIIINIDMNIGDSSATAWGCDLSFEYVRINGQYRT